MSDRNLPPLFTWLTGSMEPEVRAVVDRVRRAPDVQHVAIMPDVHLAGDVTVGTVLATDRLLYPQAVGGDIGCGMLAVAFEGDAKPLEDPVIAGRVLGGIGAEVPTMRRHRQAVLPFPEDLAEMPLSHPSLEAAARDEARLQFGTLGGGNHFIELQSDADDRLWVMIHTGSRAMGQLIRGHHVARATLVGSNLKALDAGESAGREYAHDVAWARAYAHANRVAIAGQVADVVRKVVGPRMDESTLLAVDHNHVALETVGERLLWVHRKGAMPAAEGRPGVIPGSMGTASYHVEGLGQPDSLNSSSHGAGRSMSRESARRRITAREFHRQMSGVWYDYRHASALREESPSAYKDVRAVMRAQRDLVKITRALRPLLNYKGS